VLSLLAGDGAEDRRERLRTLVAEAAPVPIAELSSGPGAVEGTVEVHTGTVDGSVTDRDAVLAEYERERNADGELSVVEGRIEAVPFLVEDDTGRVLVDPTDYDYDDGVLPISPGRTERREGDEDGENVRPVGDEGPVLPWVHSEAAIRPGDRVYVAGTVSRLAGPEGPPGVRHRLDPGDDPGAFLVTDLSRQALFEGLGSDSRLPEGFWRFALLGAILVAVVLGLGAIFGTIFLL